jgi:hypothetical protein
MQDDEYDGDHDQGMDPTACLWKTWHNAPAEKAKQPQDDQNYDDSPDHNISPFERFAL